MEYRGDRGYLICVPLAHFLQIRHGFLYQRLGAVISLLVFCWTALLTQFLQFFAIQLEPSHQLFPLFFQPIDLLFIHLVRRSNQVVGRCGKDAVIVGTNHFANDKGKRPVDVLQIDYTARDIGCQRKINRRNGVIQQEDGFGRLEEVNPRLLLGGNRDFDDNRTRLVLRRNELPSTLLLQRTTNE